MRIPSSGLAAIACLVLAGTAAAAQGHEGGPSGAFTYSTDPTIAATQKQAKSVVERYQKALNEADFPTIRTLFAPDAVAEWNTKRTMIGTEAMAPYYADLFAKIRFSTDFQYDAVDLYGDVAIVRTHHPIGQMEVARQSGKQTLDLNREIFVLRRMSGDWKIVLYTFTTQPRQGEQ